jgi:hypothetical protein
VRSGGLWSQLQKLEASDAATGDAIGQSVAISGETIVVGGAPGDATEEASFGAAAYVFVRSDGVWSQQQKLQVSDRLDLFGFDVAISGETIVVGAHGDDGTAGPDQGSAYVFVRSGGVWSEQQKLEASDAAAEEHFGFSVAISGETIVVGAGFNAGFADGGSDQGSAYVFVRSGTVWSEQQKLEASDAAAGDLFGFSVGISGETVVVGAVLDDGAAGIDQGSAYVFVRSGGLWSQLQKLEASDAATDDTFGRSPAISGGTIVVGASFDDSDDGAFQDQGSAYVFADTPPTITLNAPITLWSPNHTYRNVTVSQMVRSAGDPEDGNVINAVVIEKATSDEPDDAPGGRDGNTGNDIVIAATCTSVNLRAERDETKNGRVYSVTLRVADSAGNITRAAFKVSVPRDLVGFPAIEDAPVFTVSSSCP